MEPQTSNQDQVPAAITQTSGGSWYGPLFRASTFSRVAIAVIVVALPFVGGYLGYRVAISQQSPVDQISVVQDVNSTDAASEVLFSGVPTSTAVSDSEIAVASENLVELALYGKGTVVDCGVIIPNSKWNGVNECFSVPISEADELIGEYAGCGGCAAFYRRDIVTAAVTKLNNFPYFEGELFQRTTLTPYYIGIIPNQIFVYDPLTDGRKIVHTAGVDEVLMDCGHGCSIPDGMRVFRDNDGLYLELTVYEADVNEPGMSPVGERQRIALPNKK